MAVSKIKKSDKDNTKNNIIDKAVSGLEFKEIEIDKIVTNEWNVNKMGSEAFNRLVKEIKEVGYIEPIQVIKSGENYKIIGGEHRYLACKQLGYKEIPCIIINDEKFANEDIQKFVSVRLNVLRGKIDPERFVKLYDEMVEKYGKESMQDLMGFVNGDEYTKVLKSIKRYINDMGLPNEVKDKISKKAKDLKTVDDLSNFLHDIMAKHGNTLDKDYIVFSYNKRTIYYLMINDKVKKVIDDIIGRAEGDEKSINDYIIKIFEKYYEIGWE